MQTKADNPIDRLQDPATPALIRAYFEFCHLKQLYRQGWLLRGVPVEHCESVAEHSFGVAVLAMLLAERHEPPLDLLKLLRMALIHDFGEVYAGDIVPGAKISASEKHHLERASVERIFGNLPDGEPYIQIWEEFETGDTPEARLIRQLDKLEMALQASVYEHQDLANLRDFYRSAGEGISDPALNELLAIIRTLKPPSVL